jgi:hypothetical protein
MLNPFSKDQDVLNFLEPLRAVPERSTEAAGAGLRSFLDEAARLRLTASSPAAEALTGWRSIFRKEHSPMLVLAKIVVALVVALSGGGAAALASQASLPNEALYPIKLLVEDVRLGLTADPQTQLNLELEFAATRTREMAQLADRDQSIPEAVSLRLQTHLNTALQNAARLGDPQMQAALDQIRSTTQDQLQTMLQTRQQTQAQAQLQTAQRMLTRTRDMAELGLHDPQLFRQRLTLNRPEEAPEQPEMTPPLDNPSPAPHSTNVPPENRYGPGSPPEDTPAQNSYGPGPASTPQQNSYGAGAPPDDSPQGQLNGSGPQPADPVPSDNSGQPGGNSDPGSADGGNGPGSPVNENGGGGHH